MIGTGTRAALHRLAAPMRRTMLAAGGFGAVGLLLLVLAAAAWLARWGVLRTPAWVLGAWTVGLGVGAAAIWRTRRELRGVAPDALAARDVPCRRSRRAGGQTEKGEGKRSDGTAGKGSQGNGGAHGTSRLRGDDYAEAQLPWPGSRLV